MAQIDIVVGSVYGAAMLVAETLADELERKGHHCTLYEEARLADIDPSRFLLLISATTGQGDIPPICNPLPLNWLTRRPGSRGCGMP